VVELVERDGYGCMLDAVYCVLYAVGDVRNHMHKFSGHIPLPGYQQWNLRLKNRYLPGKAYFWERHLANNLEANLHILHKKAPFTEIFLHVTQPRGKNVLKLGDD
jgi:hypothetical protein